MTHYVAIFCLGLMLGCSSVPDGRVTHSLYSREIVLSSTSSEDDFLKAKLVAIAADGITTIEVIPTGEILRAHPGEFFAPGPYGTQGLQLISASPENQQARVLRRWCETK